jgi:ABC-2 type transport system ATP-binding protein
MRQRLGIAACLLADPELLILDEPMNGLDPAGMLEVRTMIRDFVGEGRTVVLSSHLLDEVEKTCDAVAIIDQGRMVAQGSIAEVTGGAGRTLQVECSDPARAADLARQGAWVGRVDITAGGIVAALDPGVDARQAAAYLNWQLVSAGVGVFDLRVGKPSLEDRFLEVTSTLGASQ